MYFNILKSKLNNDKKNKKLIIRTAKAEGYIQLSMWRVLMPNDSSLFNG